MSIIEVIRWIWNGFDVCIKYRVELGIKKYGKMGENTHSGQFSVTCTGTP